MYHFNLLTNTTLDDDEILANHQAECENLDFLSISACFVRGLETYPGNDNSVVGQPPSDISGVPGTKSNHDGDERQTEAKRVNCKNRGGENHVNSIRCHL